MNKLLSLFKRNSNKCKLSELLEPHLNRLYRQAYKYCGSESEAEDLLQELMLECSRREEQLRSAPVPAAWLSRVLYHRFVDRHRKNMPHQYTVDIEELVETPKSDESLEANYLHQQILRALNKLSPDQRMVISLHDIEGYTIAQISELTDISVGTLKSHLHRGRKTIKNLMQLQPNQIASR